MQKIVSVAVFAAMLFSCVSSFSLPTNAAELSDDDAYRYYDSLQAIMDNYGLSGTAIDVETDVAYFYGRRLGGTGNPVSALWVGSTCYICDYLESKEVPYYSYSTNSNAVSYYDTRVGSASVMFYYAAGSSQVQLLGGQTTNLIGYNTIAARTDVVTYSTAETLDDFVSALVPDTDTTESNAPAFTLPQDWIDGGETLPDATAETFEGIDPDKALDDFNSAVDDADDVLTDTSFVSSIGLFWQIVIDFIDTLDIWAYVILAMILGIIYWLLGR